MPVQNRSFADYLTYWVRLLQAIEANLDILPDLTRWREQLQGVIDEVQQITARQDAHRAGMEIDTKRLRVLMVTGRDHAHELRAVLVSHLGPRNPKLSEFRVRPLGKPKAPPSSEPEDPEETAKKKAA